jgi:hypothetical protein
VSVIRRGLRMPPQRLTTGTVKAGVLANATYPADETYTDARTGAKVDLGRGGMKVATIAAALNYGNSKMPARPFMNVTVAQKKRDWADAIVKLAMSGGTTFTVLGTAGQVAKEDIRKTVAAWPADNSKPWAAFKGFNHGLVLTSHLLNSIESEMEGGSA